MAIAATVMSTAFGVVLLALGDLVPRLFSEDDAVALANGWGIFGVWLGLAGLIAVRLATCGARFAGDRWARVGPPIVRSAS